MILSIDIETYSSVDLKKAGVYAYASAPDFAILLFAYTIGDGPVQIIDLAQGESIPQNILDALRDPAVMKTAYNANFERTCLQNYFLMDLPADQWRCTAVHGAMLGLPQSLGQIASVLKVDQQKDAAGGALIRYFCCPCKPTKANGERTRNLPEHAPEKWEAFKAYCIQDVETERAVRETLFKLPYTYILEEHRLWVLDQEINDRGVEVDIQFAQNAVAADKHFQEINKSRMIEVTGSANPKSVQQLKSFVQGAGVEVDTLNKKDVVELLDADLPDDVREALEIRQQLAKTSTAKYEAMTKAVCPDGRIRGLLQFYGANRTGRWAGRIVQVHNLPQNHMSDLDGARACVRDGDIESLELLYGDVPRVLSELIRTAFVAKEGHQFVVADFSAIEARVIAWLAGEKWRLDVFNSHGKIYEASAAQMFKVPIESITKGSPLRQKGKISELALGYQGGVGALMQMGAIEMGLAEEELQDLVSAWRRANPAIVKLWKDVQGAAMAALGDDPQKFKGIKFVKRQGILCIELPSNRNLSYYNARVEQGVNGWPQIVYEGVDQTTKKWGKLSTYGGKLVENIVQAIARDCLADAMRRVAEKQYEIVMHVHDEIVVETDEDCLDVLCKIMGEEISWAPGLPLRADGFQTKYYKKD